jgi:hypothetical protein
MSKHQAKQILTNQCAAVLLERRQKRLRESSSAAEAEREELGRRQQIAQKPNFSRSPAESSGPARYCTRPKYRAEAEYLPGSRGSCSYSREEEDWRRRLGSCSCSMENQRRRLGSCSCSMEDQRRRWGNTCPPAVDPAWVGKREGRGEAARVLLDGGPEEAAGKQQPVGGCSSRGWGTE